MNHANLINITKDYARRASYFVSRFKEETKGVAAIEFAFIAPLMLVMYVGTMEISNAVSANRKLSRVSSTLGDLLTQSECFTDDTLADIVKVADDIMYPYENQLSIQLNGVLTTDGVSKVQWSRAYGLATPLATGTEYVVPDKIKIDDNFLVAAQIKMSYTPSVGWITTGSKSTIKKDISALDMSEEMFLRPRIGDTVEIKTSC